MERIAYLIRQLSEMSENGESHTQLLEVANELQVLLHQSVIKNTLVSGESRIALMLPDGLPTQTTAEILLSEIQEQPIQVEEKIYEELVVDEQEIEAELEEIRKKAEFAQKLQAAQAKMKPGILFDFEDDPVAGSIPTLVSRNRQKKPAEKSHEINLTTPINKPEIIAPKEGDSINDQLKEETREVVQFLGDAPIKDLRKAIGINDRYVFINELFRGDENMYERSVKTINNFSAHVEAQYWMERELKVKLGWDPDKQLVKDFYALVKRRFS